MAVILAPGTLVRDFHTIELAGDGTLCNVYLAERDGKCYWLVQVESLEWHNNAPKAMMDNFELAGSKWVAIPTSGTTMLDLGSWVDRLETAFAGWRWTVLARAVGYLHERKQVMQHVHALSLDRLVFTEQGEFLFDQSDKPQADTYPFPPPEGLHDMTPAGDVYSLGATLEALIGKTSQKNLVEVLTRATDPTPAKRFANAAQLADALADNLPKPNRQFAPGKSPSARSILRIGCWVLVACIVLSCLSSVCGAVRLMRDPTFQQQFEQQIQRQRQFQLNP